MTAQTAAKKAPAKSTAKNTKATSAKAPTSATVDNVNLDEDAEAEAAEKAAEQARRDAELNDFKGHLTDAVADLKERDRTNAIAVREAWVGIGNVLREGQALFIDRDSNSQNDKAFGQWIKDNGFEATLSRALRASAIWLSSVYENKPELYNLFPTESKAGEPLRTSPRTLQDWVRGQIYEAFQDAYIADPDLVVASEAEKDQRAGIARQSLKNVFEVLDEAMESASLKVDEAQATLKKAKGDKARTEAMAAYNSAASVYEAMELRKNILDQHTDDELVNYYAGWKPKAKQTAFKDMPVADAAAKVFALLKTNPEFVNVYDAVGEMVEELRNKMDADAGAVQEPDAGDDADETDSGDEDFEVEVDDADADETDSGDDADDFEDDDMDEGFEDDADAILSDEADDE